MKKDDKILSEFVGVTNKRFGRHLKDIILFGSRARGDSQADSDYDCLLVFDNISPAVRDGIDDIAGEFLYTYNVIFSAFPVSETHYKKQTFNPLYMNIRRDGISL